MGLLIRDDRQRKALTGLSQDQCDHRLPVCSAISQAAQQHPYEKGVESGTRWRKPGGGSTGKLPTMADTLPCVLSDDKTSPSFDGLATPWAMARSTANENLHTLSPMLYDTLVPLELMPSRELATPEEWQAALHGVDRLLSDATERAYHRSTDEATQREHSSGKKQHPLKNTGRSLPDKLRVFLGRTLSGHPHDDRMLKQECPPEWEWCPASNVRVD